MNRPRAFIKRIALATLLLAGTLGNTQAGDYSNVYFFGDSLSDSGAYAPILAFPLLPSNARFTTNPGTVWTDNLGASYGKAVTPGYAAWQTEELPANAGGFTPIGSGNNFAVGGARVSLQPGNLSNNPLLEPSIPSVRIQVNDFLARGPLDSKALYAVMGGSNDIFVQATAVGPQSMISVEAATNAARPAIVTAANDFVAQIARLQAAGARNLMVIGLPDIGMTPVATYAANNGAPNTRQLLSNLTAIYDAQQAAGLAGKNLLYFDGNKLFNAIFASPTAYGFSNTTNPKCGWSTPALGCAAAADGYMFADVVHWSTGLHKVMSDWIYASLEGASRVGLLSQMPLAHSSAQWRAIDARLQEFQNFGTEGQGFFISGGADSAKQDAAAGLPSADGSGSRFVMGYEKAFSAQLLGGVTLGYGHTPFDLGNHQGTVNTHEWALSAFAAHKLGNFYANAVTTYSWLDYASTRNVALGPYNSSERGDTRGGQWGVKGQIGYNWVSGNWVHGPLLGLAWERVRVDGFSEQSNSVTAMTFGEQSRQSLRSRLGWQVAAESHWSGVKVRPYAQLTYDYEHKKEENTYRAGFVGGNTSLEIPMVNRTGGYGTLLAGVNAELSKTLRLGVTASTTIGQPGARSSAIDVALSVPF
jgi:outer membrane lipase/esterase